MLVIVELWSLNLRKMNNNFFTIEFWLNPAYNITIKYMKKVSIHEHIKC